MLHPRPSQTPRPARRDGQAEQAQGAPAAAPFVRRAAPTVTTPLPAAPPPAQALKPLAAGAPAPGPRNLNDFRAERHESQQGGRTVITEPGRVIIRDPNGEAFIRHNEVDRFRFGARDIQTQHVGGETRTIVVRPDGSQIITIVGSDGQLLRRIRRDQQGREIIIIDNSYRDPRAVGGFYVDLPPPVIRIPYDRYIVDAADAPPDLIYDTMEAPPVDRIDRRYSLDEIRYSPSVRMLMPSIDLNTINFETGSWEIPPDQAAKLQVIADGLNRAIQRNPREVFLIEGHTDAVGNDVDNLSLSDRRAESAAELLDPAIRRARGKPDVAGLRLAISEGTDRRTEPHQPARHRPPHHAVAQWRHCLAAAAAARHRCRRGKARASCSKMAGSNPGHFRYASRKSLRRPERTQRPSAGSLRHSTGRATFATAYPGCDGRPSARDDRDPHCLSLSSLKIGEPSPLESKPVSA